MNVPFVEAVHVGRKHRPTAILLRASFTTGQRGAANGIAQAWHNPNNKLESCHFVVDEFQTLNCVPIRRATFPDGHEWPNAITINICFNPPDSPSPAVVERTLDLVVQLAMDHGLKTRVLSEQEIVSWRKRRWKRRGGIILKRNEGYPAYSFTVLNQILENLWDSTTL